MNPAPFFKISIHFYEKVQCLVPYIYVSGSHAQTADQTLNFGVNVKGAKTVIKHRSPSLSFFVLDSQSITAFLFIGWYQINTAALFSILSEIIFNILSPVSSTVLHKTQH